MSSGFIGWKFPVVFNKYSRSVDVVDSLDDSIKESLYVLLTTTPGERLMELEYGCNIKSIAFKPLNLNLKTYISNNIKNTITKWEDRIELLNVDVDDSHIDGMLNINIQYVIKASSEESSLTFNYMF